MKTDPSPASWSHPHHRTLWQVKLCAVCMGIFWAHQARLVEIMVPDEDMA